MTDEREKAWKAYESATPNLNEKGVRRVDQHIGWDEAWVARDSEVSELRAEVARLTVARDAALALVDKMTFSQAKVAVRAALTDAAPAAQPKPSVGFVHTGDDHCPACFGSCGAWAGYPADPEAAKAPAAQPKLDPDGVPFRIAPRGMSPAQPVTTRDFVEATETHAAISGGHTWPCPQFYISNRGTRAQCTCGADALIASGAIPTAQPVTTRETVRESIMLTLHEQGAFCGLCDYENAIYEDRSEGIEWRCADCEKCLRRYANALIAAGVIQTDTEEKP